MKLYCRAYCLAEFYAALSDQENSSVSFRRTAKPAKQNIPARQAT